MLRRLCQWRPWTEEKRNSQPKGRVATGLEDDGARANTILTKTRWGRTNALGRKLYLLVLSVKT